ncbi:hypothetical protein [Bacillus cereus]|uniref:hypothetical protein n=1 Tax=Bacillus cereus TaxID=1396 RepID=UPI001F276CF5|nr:hypothetical protein [Bacillus cereus]BCC54937.1 hypothetical protein BCJMU07_4287 [Bacillus cereus]BCC78699.1 hypothetical protein BCJMU62_4390 [Bacillus cereus]HDR8098952.1 hypothetical protein [Bacillus cereus]HDR8100055.1 hypothetical protein [Bacillus cereus]
MEELLKGLRELHQINIYSVDENWCIQLFDLDVCPNDYGVQPCPEFECVFETSGNVLYDVLSDALEWAKEQLENQN